MLKRFAADIDGDEIARLKAVLALRKMSLTQWLIEVIKKETYGTVLKLPEVQNKKASTK